MLDRLGATADKLDVADKELNATEQASEELKICNRVKVIFNKEKEDFEDNCDADPSCCEALDAGVQVSQIASEDYESVGAEEFFSDEAGVAKKHNALAQAEAKIDRNTASLTLVSL